VLLPEQSLEAGHAVVVGVDGGELRVVESPRDPSVIHGKSHPQPPLERLDLAREAREQPLLPGELLRARQPRGVQPREPVAGRAQQPHQLPVIGPLALEGREPARLPAVLEPALQSRVLHGHGEGLVEARVIGHVQQLVRQLVKDHGRELAAAVAHHGAHHRIGQLAERRIRRHTLDHDVIAAPLEMARVGARPPLIEVAAIGDAPGDREAPLLRPHGQRRRRHHVPDHVAPVQFDVRAVARVVGEPELPGGEPARLADLAELADERLRRARVVDHLHDRPALVQHVPLPVGRLQQIQRARAAGETRTAEGREQEPGEPSPAGAPGRGGAGGLLG
jgi:hypothetical protein